MSLALFPSHVPAPVATEGRDTLDRYYTPLPAALACCRALREAGLSTVPSMLEPAVGAGAWVTAARRVWPEVYVSACDLDPAADGLALADVAQVADFTDSRWVEQGDYALVAGNRPYADPLQRWVDRALELAPAVAFLERGTILGSDERLAWWQANPPTHVWVLAQRPRWGGMSPHYGGDSSDTVLVLWRRRPKRARRSVTTRLHWLGWR